MLVDARLARRRRTGIARVINETRTALLVDPPDDMEVVFEIADDITVMAQGAILATGSPKDIAANEKVREAYLGRPEDEDYTEEAAGA